MTNRKYRLCCINAHPTFDNKKVNRSHMQENLLKNKIELFINLKLEIVLESIKIW